MVDLKSLFNTYSNELRANFKKTRIGQHSGLKGIKREDILKELLKEYFPVTHEVVCRGEIFDNKNNVSKEMDIIIYNVSIPVFKSESTKLFPIDSIYGVCQVKSLLDKNELRNAVLNIQSAKKMILPRPTGYYGRYNDRVYGSVFSYDGEIGNIHRDLLEIYADENIPKEEQIDPLWTVNRIL
jgi:hypothetical protein